MTQIADVMTRGVRTLTPHDSVISAAQAMEEMDVGAIPVCDGDHLVGMVTDRDIVLRAVAHNRANDQTTLGDVMTAEPLWCYDDQSVDDVIEAMREAQLRRMPVVDRSQQLVGIVSLGDLAVKADEGQAGEALEQISEPAAPARPERLAAMPVR
jgi:CBS domain-containing protein